MNKPAARIVLGGGCFWCMEAVFEMVPGVISVQAGYAGGRTKKPTYREVSSGRTGHAEVVRVEYNAAQILLWKLLEIFFLVHDPTTLNRQGSDVGEQYRSVVFYYTTAQRRIIDRFIGELQRPGRYGGAVVTQVNKLDHFYRAEEEHQNYWRKNPRQAYCQAVIAPKVNEIKSRYSQAVKK